MSKIFIELFHFVKWLIRCHYNFNVFEFIHSSQNISHLVFAVFTFRTKKHQHGKMMFFKIVFSKISCAINF